MSRMVGTLLLKQKDINMEHLNEAKSFLTPLVGAHVVDKRLWPHWWDQGIDFALRGLSGASGEGAKVAPPVDDSLVPPALRGGESAVRGVVGTAGSEAEAGSASVSQVPQSDVAQSDVPAKSISSNTHFVFGRWGDLGPNGKCTLAR